MFNLATKRVFLRLKFITTNTHFTMRHYYSLKTNGLQQSRSLNSWNSSYLLVLLFSLFSSIAMSQNSATNSTITDLLNQRAVLIEQSQSTRDLDVQLFELGYRPKAVIRTQTLENGSLRIEFPIYKALPEEKKERVIQRLSSYYASTILSMEIDTELLEVTVFVNATISTEEIDAIIDHFGYEGHE